MVGADPSTRKPHVGTGGGPIGAARVAQGSSMSAHGARAQTFDAEQHGATSDAATLLREKGRLTRMLILRQLAEHGPSSLRRLADGLGVTTQAVSEHVRKLTASGLTESKAEGTVVTALGRERLHGELLTIKRYVDDALHGSMHIERTGATAGAAIRAGDAVGLRMDMGRMTAHPGLESGSRGVALSDAEPGQDVTVAELEGYLDLRTGTVTFALLPDAIEGGSRDVDRAALVTLASNASLVAAQGPVARFVVASAQPTHLVTWGVAEAAAEAALRGLDVLVLVERWEADDTRRRFDQAASRWGLQAEVQTTDLGA